MAITDLPLFQALKEKMAWHQTRQGVLAENIANADTPGYQAKDLRAYKFEGLMEAARGQNGTTGATMQPVRTDEAHLGSGPQLAQVSSRRALQMQQDVTRKAGLEVTPDGNDVVLEEQMMKLAQNQMDYQMATSLYTRSLGLLKTALRRSA